MLSVPAVQVPHPLTARLPPEVQETVSNRVVLKHNIVHMSVFLGGEQKKFMQQCFESCGVFRHEFAHKSWRSSAAPVSMSVCPWAENCCPIASDGQASTLHGSLLPSVCGGVCVCKLMNERLIIIQLNKYIIQKESFNISSIF